MSTAFTIGEASRLVGRSIKTIRRYEDAGLIEPQRIGGHRIYTEADIARLRVLAAEHSERQAELLGWHREAVVGE